MQINIADENEPVFMYRYNLEADEDYDFDQVRDEELDNIEETYGFSLNGEIEYSSYYNLIDIIEHNGVEYCLLQYGGDVRVCLIYKDVLGDFACYGYSNGSNYNRDSAAKTTCKMYLKEYYESSTIPQDPLFFAKFEELTNTHCKYLFGELNYRLVSSDRSVDLYIKFPKLVISNSKNYSKILRDLLVKVEFKRKPNGLRLSLLKGSRATLNYGEFFLEKLGRCNYYHSHLPYKSNVGYDAFCLGESALGMICASLGCTWDDNTYLALLYQLPEYLSYESLEGGPHVKMFHTDIFKSIENRSLDTDRIADRIAKHIVHNPDSPYRIEDLADVVVQYTDSTGYIPSVTFKLKDIDFTDLVKSCIESNEADSKYSVKDQVFVTMRDLPTEVKKIGTIKFGTEDLEVKVVPVEQEDIDMEIITRKIEDKSMTAGNDIIVKKVRLYLEKELKKFGLKLREEYTDEWTECFA